MGFLWDRAPGEAPAAAAPPAEAEGRLDWRNIAAAIAPREYIAIVAAGIVAFFVSGSLGYPNQFAQPWLSLFHPPGLLFLWFSGVMLLLLLRHPSLSGRRTWPVAVFLASVVLVIAVYVDNKLGGHVLATLIQWIQDIFTWLGFSQPGVTRILFNLINFLILGVYTLRMLARWIGRYLLSGGLGGASTPDAFGSDSIISANRPITSMDLDQALRGELLSGDFLAGAALAGLMALLFSTPVINGILPAFAPFLIKQVHIDVCTATLPGSWTGHCPPIAQSGAYISVFDTRVMVGYAIAGGLIVATAAAIKAIGSMPHTRGMGLWPAAERLILEFARSLLAALGRLLTLRFIALIKDVLWLLCILVAAVGAGFAGQYVQCNLRLVGGDTTINTSAGPQICILSPASNLNLLLALGALLVLGTAVLALTLLPRGARSAVPRTVRGLIGFLFLTFGLIESVIFAQTLSLGLNQQDRYVLFGIAAMLAALMVLVLGVGLWLESLEFIVQTMLSLALCGFIVLNTFWVFSLGMAGVDYLVGSALKQAFQITHTTLFSLIAFLITLVAVIIYRYGFHGRGGKAQPGAPAPELPRTPDPSVPPDVLPSGA